MACFAYKKGLDLPRLPLTLKRNPIFVRKNKKGTTGRIARFDLKKELDSQSLHLTFTCHVIFTKKIRSEGLMSLKGR